MHGWGLSAVDPMTVDDLLCYVVLWCWYYGTWHSSIVNMGERHVAMLRGARHMDQGEIDTGALGITCLVLCDSGDTLDTHIGVLTHTHTWLSYSLDLYTIGLRFHSPHLWRR